MHIHLLVEFDGLQFFLKVSWHNPRHLGTCMLKMIRKFFKTNIFIVAYTLVSPKKYFVKNLELCGPRNLLFSTAASATKLQFGGF